MPRLSQSDRHQGLNLVDASSSILHCAKTSLGLILAKCEQGLLSLVSIRSSKKLSLFAKQLLQKALWSPESRQVGKYQGRNHDFHFGGGKVVTPILILKGGLEVTIGGGLTMVEEEELRKFYDFQTPKHAITGHTLG